MDATNKRNQSLATFCHDHLKGDFTRSVVRFVRVLQGQTQDTEFAKRFGSEIVSIWSDLANRTRDLLEDIMQKQDPIELFNYFPLDKLNFEDRQWMSELLRKSWSVNEATQNQYSSILVSIEEITNQCKILEPLLSSFVTKKQTEECSNNFSSENEWVTLIDAALELHQQCLNVISMINRFPNPTMSFSLDLNK